MEDFSQVINEAKLRLRQTNLSNVRQMYDVASILYDAMYQHYDYCELMEDESVKVKTQYRICQLIDQEVLPKLAEAMVATRSDVLRSEMYDLHKKFFALSARRIMKNFAFYIELYKHKKVWDKTMPTVESMFYYADILSISDNMKMYRASLMPSMGKSYFANLYVAQCCGVNPNIHILRITYAEHLCKTTTNQTESIINSKAYREIFPRYKDRKGMSIFKSATKESFCMCDCEDEYNFFAVTRDGQSTGKRANILIIDDLLKDNSESYNKELHKNLVDRYESTWSSRAEDDNFKVMLLGTMWADTDLLNVMYDRTKEESKLVPSTLYKYTEIAENGSAVFIGIPALDENDKSTCPSRYSTASLKKKRKNTSKFLWQCVYQQDPIAPDGLEFDYSVLRKYEKPPTLEQSESRYASLDPARKGKNYVSMPITYRTGNDYYLVDFLYQKKGMDDLYDAIVDKIIEHRLNILVVENNTDTSLRMVLEERLRWRGYLACTIIEIYSTKNKEQRINDCQSAIRNYILFPQFYSTSTDLGMAIEAITSYSFSYPNKFDDAIDSLAILAAQFIKEEFQFPEIETFERRW